jgi:pimeloyl-ACP methyl ester carboxylesterase
MKILHTGAVSRGRRYGRRMPDPQRSTSGTVTVSGRVVGLRWFGAERSDGTPVVLYQHGGLSCGADAALGHDAAAERGVAVLAVDRPGIGASDPQPGRTTGDATALLVGVLDELGIDRTVGAVGWSLGGQYALAAGREPERVPRVAVVAGVPPLDRPGVRDALSTTDKALLWTVSRHVPGFVAAAAFGAVHHQSERTAHKRDEHPDGRSPGRSELRVWGPADAEVLAGPAGRVIDDAVALATRSTAAMREEYRAWARPWAFGPEDVSVPVVVWQGDQDRWVGQDLARQLADAAPHGRVRPCPGRGHLLLAHHWGDVLDDLLGSDAT